MKQQCDRVAGLDVHRDTVVACLRLGRGDEPEVQRKEVLDDHSWGRPIWPPGWPTLRCTRVVMESTGVYWKCVYYPLEGLFDELWLVNAGHVKNVPGRKTDIADAEWLADVAAHGMVRPSFVPPPPVRELRELTRYRKTQIVMRAQEIQRLDKVLQDAGIKISSVASNVLGKSTRAMIEALIAGERDPAVLADMAKARMRAKIPALTEALVGRFAAHHGAVARAILDHIDFLDATIARLDEEVASRLGPFRSGRGAAGDHPRRRPARPPRRSSPRPGPTWPGSRPPPSCAPGREWLRRTTSPPANAAQPAPAKAPAGCGESLIESAKAASRTKDTYLAAQYRQIAPRRGPNKATVAVAHSILFAAWHMLTTGETYNDLGPDWLSRVATPNARPDASSPVSRRSGIKSAFPPRRNRLNTRRPC